MSQGYQDQAYQDYITDYKIPHTYAICYRNLSPTDAYMKIDIKTLSLKLFYQLIFKIRKQKDEYLFFKHLNIPIKFRKTNSKKKQNN